MYDVFFRQNSGDSFIFIEVGLDATKESLRLHTCNLHSKFDLTGHIILHTVIRQRKLK